MFIEDRTATQHAKLLKLLYLSTQSYALELSKIKLIAPINLAQQLIKISNTFIKILYRHATTGGEGGGHPCPQKLCPNNQLSTTNNTTL